MQLHELKKKKAQQSWCCGLMYWTEVATINCHKYFTMENFKPTKS